MSIPAIKWALAQKTGSSTAKAVLIAIANYADEEGRCWPSQRRLAEDTEFTERSIRNALTLLEERGLLKRTARKRRNGSRASDGLQLGFQPEPVSYQPERSSYQEECVSHQPETGSRKTEARSAPTTFEPSTEPPKEPVKSVSRKRTSYSDDFEAFWRAYPDTTNNTKAKAFAEWERLTPEDRLAALAGLSAYAAHCRKSQTSFLHAERYLKYRRFESFSGAAKARASPAEDTLAKLESFLRDGFWSPTWGQRPDNPESPLHGEWQSKRKAA